MRSPEFAAHDPRCIGANGLVLIGDKVLVYRRDTNTTNHALEIDLPGGRCEAGETPLETFIRETKEEFGLNITEGDIVGGHTYQSQSDPTRIGYFFVARLPADAATGITLGNEGTEYMLETPAEYLARGDAWEYVRDQARLYLEPQTVG